MESQEILIDVLLGDKGYDDQQIRAIARESGARPLIKHREFSSLQKAWNARLDTELRPTEAERNSQLSTQAEIRCIRSLTTLVEAVS